MDNPDVRAEVVGISMAFRRRTLMPSRFFGFHGSSSRQLLRASTCLIASMMVGGSLTLIGCDTDSGKADKNIEQQVTQATAAMNGSADDQERAQKLIADAAGQSNAVASYPYRIRAKALQAQGEVAAAERLTPQIAANQAEINRLSWEIDNLAAQIKSRIQLSEALAKYEPTSVQNAIKKNVADVQQGDADKKWVKSDTGVIDALAAVNATIASKQSDISKLQETIRTLTDQRTQLVAQADTLTQQSEREKGDKSVDLFKQGSGDQKKAADLTVQIDQTNVLLSRAQEDLATQQGQQAVLNDAVAGFGDKSNQVDVNWSQINKQAGDLRTQAAKNLLGDETNAPDVTADPTGGKTISAKGARIVELAEANQKLREEAETDLNNAVQFFKDAVQMAELQQKDLKTRMQALPSQDKPEVIAWNALINVQTPARYRLQEANAEQHRASLFVGRVNEASTRSQTAANLKAVLDDAKLTMPAMFDDSDNKIAQSIDEGHKDADLAYNNASDLLTGIIDGAAPKEQQQAATIARIFNQYGWSLLAASAGDTQKADEHLKDAKDARDQAVSTGAVLTNLPPDLAMAKSTAAPTPGQ
jgi:hypothetical protein